MADIRVERKGGTKAWQWILLALIVLALALFLLHQAGYIELPFTIGATDAPATRLAATTAFLPLEA
jgi:hypothetical protein